MKKALLLSSMTALALIANASYASVPATDIDEAVNPTAVHYDNNTPNDYQVYVQVNGGGNMLQDQYAVGEIKTAEKTEITGLTVPYKLGWNAGAAVGIKYGSWRAEIAGGYIQNNIKKKLEGFKKKGKITATTVLVNGYYDFNIGSQQWIPYAGVGIGAAFIKTDYGKATKSGSNPTPVKLKTSNTDTVLAYQGILGVAYQINPNLRVFGEYRHLATAPVTTKYDNFKPKSYYQNNLFNIGISYMFNM